MSLSNGLPPGHSGAWCCSETLPRARRGQAASGRTRCAGLQAMGGTPPDRPAEELCKAPQTAPRFHPQPFLSFSPQKERGTERAAATCRRIPGRCLWHPGGKAGQWKEGRGSHPHLQTSQRLAARRWLRSPREPTPPGRLPCSPTAPAPPPILPAPQRPPTRVREWEGAAWAAGATGVGAALSALPGSKRLGRVPLTFSEASPGPRTPRPARARKLPPGAGGRGGAEHPAARGSAQRPPLAPLLLASQVSPSLLRSVRSCVRLSVGPSLPSRRRRGRRRSSPGSAARPLPASPLRSRARGLAGSLARALPPPLPAPRGAEPGGPPAAWRGPSPEGGGDGGAARAGRRGESGGGGEAAPLPPDRSPATERLQAGPESAEGETRRTRRLAAGGCPGRGRARGSDSPREGVCV